MSPQVGADLPGAGYPISRPLLALLGGNGNLAQPNLPIKTNMDFGLGVLVDGTTSASASSGSVYSVAVPVSPGDVITKVSLLVGATSTASATVTNAWAALYTGTGSAPGTAGAAPVLVSQTASLSGANFPSSTRLDFTFTTPQTITSIQAPFGYIYASYSFTIGSGSPNMTTPSLVSMTAGASTSALWFATSPVAAYMTSNGGAGSAAPATIGTATRAANPPIVLLS